MSKVKVFTDKIMELIAKDEMASAIEETHTLLKDSPLFDEFILQSARYNDIMKSIRMGTIGFDDASVETNKIRYALIDILRELEEGTGRDKAMHQEVEAYLKKREGAMVSQAKITGDGNFNIQGISGSQINISTGNTGTSDKKKDE